MLGQYDSDIMRMLVLSDVFGLWVDNYSKLKWKLIASTEQGVKWDANYTGWGLLRGSILNNLKHSSPQVVPVWPDDLANDEAVAHVLRDYAVLRKPGFWKDYYEDHYYRRIEDIANHPPKDAATEVSIYSFVDVYPIVTIGPTVERSVNHPTGSRHARKTTQFLPWWNHAV